MNSFKHKKEAHDRIEQWDARFSFLQSLEENNSFSNNTNHKWHMKLQYNYRINTLLFKDDCVYLIFLRL